jgi:hypothetical protein
VRVLTRRCAVMIGLGVALPSFGCVSEVTCDSADGDPDVDEPSEPTPRPADPCADITSATECCDAGCHVVRGYAGEGVASCVSPANNCFQERDACHADEVCMVYRTSTSTQ